MAPGVTTLPARYNPPVSTREAQAALEREIADLDRRVGRAQALLASLRSHGPEPRGMLAGVAVGIVFVVLGFVAFAWMVMSVVERATG